MTLSPTALQLLEVLDDLAALIAELELDDRTPTPCGDLNYSELLQHTVGWASAFTDGVTSPEGRCPDPDDVVVMGNGAYQVQRCADRLEEALASVPADRPVWIGEMQVPAGVALSMMLLEFQVHGWDLARAGDRPWAPGQDGLVASLEFAAGITDEQRGDGRPFGPRVDVTSPDPLPQLLGLAGRDPAWGTTPDQAGDGLAAAPAPSEPAAASGSSPAEPPAEPAAASGSVPVREPRVATGTFTVTEFTPQPFTPAVDTALDTDYTLMRKEFHGSVAGWSQTQFISAFDHERSRGSYLALESFTGTVDGRQGTFNLAHSATTFGGPERAHELVLIVPFSGTGELTGITGTGAIRLDPDGTHHLELYYQL